MEQLSNRFNKDSLDWIHSREQLLLLIEQETKQRMKAFLKNEQLQPDYAVHKEHIDGLLDALEHTELPDITKQKETSETVNTITQELVTFIEEYEHNKRWELNTHSTHLLKSALAELYIQTQTQAFQAYAQLQKHRSAMQIQNSLPSLADDFGPLWWVITRLATKAA